MVHKHISYISLISVKCMMGPDGDTELGGKRLAPCLEDLVSIGAILWFQTQRTSVQLETCSTPQNQWCCFREFRPFFHSTLWCIITLTVQSPPIFHLRQCFCFRYNSSSSCTPSNLLFVVAYGAIKQKQ